MRHRPAVLLAALLVSGAVACADSPTAPGMDDASPGARLSASGRPTALPNVVRYGDDTGGFFVDDPVSGIVAVEGLPLDPRTLFICPGGTAYASPLTIQDVGQKQGVSHRLIKGRDVGIHLYRAGDYTGDILALICGATPYAVGTGDIVVTANDYDGVSGHRSHYGINFRGTVTETATGETLRVTALAQATYDPATGSYDGRTTAVRTHAAGGR